MRRPALPLRHRHGYAAGIHHGLPAAEHMTAKEFPANGRRQVRTAPSPYPPDLSWWAVKGRQTPISCVHLPVSLTGPAVSGSTTTSRRCQGCSHPSWRLPGQAAPSFTQPLRRPGGRGLSPPLDFARFVAHVILGPVIANKQHRSPHCRYRYDCLEEITDDLMVRCSPNEPGHAIPAVVDPLTTSGRTVCRKTSTWVRSGKC